MMSADGWTTIESDPGVFTELMEQIGVQDVQMEELYALDVDELKRCAPVYGLIFLFKWEQAAADSAPPMLLHNESVFFANQVINNACATQAILSVLLNNDSLNAGEKLDEFKSFTMSLPPDMRGEAIGNSEMIRTAHNSFAALNLLHEEGGKGPKEDPFHFVAYLPRAGHLLELDGLQHGPINHGEASEEDWLEKVVAVLQARVAKYQSSEIRFNLMAMVKSKLATCSEAVAAAADEGEKAVAEAALLQEQERRAHWAEENRRRKHNFVPLIVELLRIMKEKGAVGGALDEAKAKAKAEAEAEKAKEAAKKSDASV